MDLEDAIILATDAHRDRCDEAGRPYIWHPLRVALRLDDRLAQMAAVLHDVVEDTPMTAEDLRRGGCPESVVVAVEALTKRAGEDYLAFIDRLAADPLARVVKLADLADNLDDGRLALLPREEQARLRAKYEPAMARLSARR